MSETEFAEPVFPSRTMIAIVGGGYAGLSAALSLDDEGIDVVVLEAAGRVGGRILSEQRESGLVIDHGGQWVGPTQRNLLALADRFDVKTFPTHTSGANLELWHDGSMRHFSIAGPDDGPGMDAYVRATEHIDALAATVDLDHPERTPQAEALDSETAHTHFQRTVPDADARMRLALAVQGVWTVEPRDISMLHLLFYVASAGGFEQLMEVEGCAQDSRFTDGAQETALRMAIRLGDRVHLNTPVSHVSHDAEGVTLVTSRGALRADRAIVALPPSAAQRMTFDPPLPPGRRRWWAKSPMGDVAKIHVVYDSPFWRNAGLSGEASVYGDPAVGVIFDNSPLDASRGVLVCFVYADRLHRWTGLAPDQRRQEVLDLLARLYGDEAAAPLDYLEKNWSEDLLAGGGYAANPTPGTWIEHGARGWRSPVGRIHWAGTETASVWNGYMEGAIASGYRAAAEVRAGS